MRLCDPRVYLPVMGINANVVIECMCAGCTNEFPIVDGFACEASVGNRQTIAFVCSPACYLAAVPSERMGHA